MCLQVSFNKKYERSRIRSWVRIRSWIRIQLRIRIRIKMSWIPNSASATIVEPYCLILDLGPKPTYK
jgi:hypothetical protein